MPDSDLERDYRALRDDAGAVWRARDAIRVAGPDALAFLDGQLSQDVKAMAVGAAADSLLLQPQGKVVALLRVHRVEADEFMLDTDAGWTGAVIERLERFKLRTNATIDAVQGWRCLAVSGPRAHEVASGLVTDWPGWPGIDIVGDSPVVPEGVGLVGDDAYEAARIEAGVPVMGRELTEQTIPAEATGVVERAVSFTKGCYTGQELVARVDSRGGNVPRRLYGVEFESAEVPAAGTPLHDDGGDQIGSVTSAALSPRRGAAVGLAFVSRKVEPPVRVPGAWIRPLPLV
jgi:folate-binding protein YgfZ